MVPAPLRCRPLRVQVRVQGQAPVLLPGHPWYRLGTMSLERPLALVLSVRSKVSSTFQVCSKPHIFGDIDTREDLRVVDRDTKLWEILFKVQ